jgi:UPF0755 protein
MYRKKVLLAIVFFTLIIGGLFAYKVYSSLFFSNTNFEEETIRVYIPTKADDSVLMKEISPFLKDAKAFYIVARQKGYLDRIKPGMYILSKGMSNNDIVNKLRLRSDALNVSFNNENTFSDLASRISKLIEADSTSLLKSFNDKDFYTKNGFTDETALAMYLPNTYKFYWNTTADEFRDRMLREYNRYWNSFRIEKANSISLTPIEVITLASIVHKESVKVDERPRIAGVYLNRLEKNMKLQADPTVIYAIKKSSGNFSQVIRRVLYKDLKLDSPYNTYKYKGLPPGPIAMPDISAIEAVLNAEDHDFLFFVADVKNYGYHIFASTLRQHNKNRKLYVRWINEQKINR